jgi:hypothetical protein
MLLVADTKTGSFIRFCCWFTVCNLGIQDIQFYFKYTILGYKKRLFHGIILCTSHVIVNIKISLTILGMILGIATTGLVTALSMSEMQIQPAYSQTSHCVDRVPPPPGTICITTGQDPSSRACTPGGVMCETTGLTHQQAGQAIGQQHQDCAQGIATGCTVTRTP